MRNIHWMSDAIAIVFLTTIHKSSFMLSKKYFMNLFSLHDDRCNYGKHSLDVSLQKRLKTCR